MKPLDGCLVVALEQAVAAPLCTARLADAGARVIKVERESGDFARGYDAAALGDSSYFVWLNQGKESLVLDIKAPSDLELLESIVDRADVFIQNLGPGATARLGLDAETLRRRNPRLITCDISGYGDAPELAHMKAYDLLIQAESGLLAVSGGEHELGRIGVSICDIGAGMTAHAAILEALLLRERTGEGASLKVSLFGVASEWMAVPLVHCRYGSGPPRRVGLKHPSIAPYGAYTTSDGEATLVAIQNEREWRVFCESVLDAPELATDPRFDSNNTRVANRDALDATIGKRVGVLVVRDFRQKLSEAAIAYGAINELDNVVSHPAMRWREVGNVDGARLAIPASPVVWFLPDRQSERTVPPAVGADTHRIRQEFGACR